MNSKALLPRILVLLIIASFSTLAVSSTLVYEREYSSFESGANTLRITLDEQGVLTVDRPMFMKNPGSFEFQVDPERYLELSAQLTAMPIDTEEFKSVFEQRLEQQSIYISHTEMSRFLLLDQSRNVIDSLEIESIDAQYQIAKDDANLAQARTLEQQWWELMNAMLAAQAEGEKQ